MNCWMAFLPELQRIAWLRAYRTRAAHRLTADRQPRRSRAVTRVATAMKLAAVPSAVALRNTMPAATVHTQTVMPVGAIAVG